jgi:hypothetical protein
MQFMFLHPSKTKRFVNNNRMQDNVGNNRATTEERRRFKESVSYQMQLL